jgi:uncharacterized protein (TIGR03067 family)
MTAGWCIAVAVCAAGARAAGPGASAVEGVWQATSMEKDGEKAPKEAVKHMRFRFVGDQLFIRGNFSDDREDACAFSTDETKDPKWLDFTPPGTSKPVPGIYERHGRTLRVCFRHGGSREGRPGDFKTAPGTNLVSIDFRLE